MEQTQLPVARRGTAQRAGQTIPDPPTGRARLKWLGPGFLWMVSAAGSGELLFTPRVGSLYGYALIWALVLAVAFKWFINREVGRYAVCTGRPILEGFRRLPGPGHWALWLILIPQALVAIATIAGLGSGAATAAILVFPGSVELWSIALILLATALVLWGRYGGVEKAATVIALLLAVSAIAAAVTVFSGASAFFGGFVPSLPADLDYGEILPWIGFALSGAAGMMWYSYWLAAKGYGAAGGGESRDERHPRIDPRELGEDDQVRLRGWLQQLTLDNSVAVVGTMLIMLAFLVLGTELLRPEGLVPAEEEMADTLGRLLGAVWGPAGYWIMVGGVLIGFWSTVVSDQDGFGRLFANGTRLLVTTVKRARHGNREHGIAAKLGEGTRGETTGAGENGPADHPGPAAPDEERSEPSRWKRESFLMKVYVIGLVTILPVGLYLLLGEPVTLLQIAGAIEAAHIPVLAGLTLYLNSRELPKSLGPSRAVFGATVVAALFFLAFAGVYAYQLASGHA